MHYSNLDEKKTNKETAKTNKETAKVLNTLFSNVVQNINISRFPDSDPLIRNIKDQTLKTILKYRKHTSITAIESKYGYATSFNFVEVNEADIKNKIYLNRNKTLFRIYQLGYKVIKENLNIFGSFLCNSFGSSIKTSTFLRCLKLADIIPLYKKGKNDQKENCK